MPSGERHRGRLFPPWLAARDATVAVTAPGGAPYREDVPIVRTASFPTLRRILARGGLRSLRRGAIGIGAWVLVATLAGAVGAWLAAFPR